ncbi:MAG: hypothetical protein H6907_18125 [Hyphomicrobiales bacterium]|nr:hypothetical protein [Hyphomicrobiales bacterium]MCP5373652.1 hypothetical protein [Hyphomicrobiales bacterium]
MTVLSGTNGNTALLTILNQMQVAQERKLSLAVNGVQSEYQTKINVLAREEVRWEDVKEGTDDARAVFSGAVGRLESIRSRLNALISSVNKAEQESGTVSDLSGYGAAFDSILKGINDSTTKTRDNPNLISAKAASLTYVTSITGASLTVSSYDSGSSYTIVDSSGKKWVPNFDAKLLKRWDTYPTDPATEAGAFRGGLQLDSVAGDAVTFTVAPGTASPQSYSGTITKTGLGVVNAWYYDELSTSDGRQRALDDLETAVVGINLEIKRLELARDLATFHSARAQKRIEGLGDKSNDLLVEQARAVQETQERLQREFDTVATVLAGTAQQQQEYAALLSPLFSQDPFSEAVVDVFA